MHLYIGNKCYSSWSLRPWLLAKAFDFDFDETVIPLFTDTFRDEIARFSSAGLVPILHDGPIRVWETLAIIEYLADKAPDKQIWPAGIEARAHARSISSEMHSGFKALRAACPMNLAKRYARRDRGADVTADVKRIEELFAEARDRFADAGGPFLYGAFSAADAMYAPVVTRLDTYDFDVTPKTRTYMDAVLAHPAFQAWRNAALNEPWVVPEDEVDEPAIENLRPHVTP